MSFFPVYLLKLPPNKKQLRERKHQIIREVIHSRRDAWIKECEIFIVFGLKMRKRDTWMTEDQISSILLSLTSYLDSRSVN